MFEKPGEEDGSEGDFEVGRQAFEPRQLQIGEGGDKIEIPVGGGHRFVRGGGFEMRSAIVRGFAGLGTEEE